MANPLRPFNNRRNQPVRQPRLSDGTALPAPPAPQQPDSFQSPAFAFDDKATSNPFSSPTPAANTTDAAPTAAVVTTSSSSSSGTSTMAGDSALAKQVRQDEAIKQDYHDKLVDKDTQIDELTKALEKAKSWSSNATKELNRLKAENKELTERTKHAEEMCESQERSIKSIKAHQRELMSKAEQDKKLIKAQESRIHQYQIEIERLKPSRDTQMLEQQIYAMQVRAEAAEADEKSAKEALQKIHSELRQLYQDEQPMSLEELLECARNEHHELQQDLQRQDSRSSLFSEQSVEAITRPKAQRRFVSGASLADQLDDAGETSSIADDATENEEQEPADDDDNDVPAVPAEDDTIKISPPLYMPPPSQRARDRRVLVHPYLQVANIFVLLLFLALCVLLGRERYLWSSANNLAATHMMAKGMALSGTRSWNPFLGLFSALDASLGVRYGLLG